MQDVELSLLSPTEYREALYNCWSQPDSSFESRVGQMLEIGTAYLNTDHGHVSRIDTAAGTEEVIAATDDDLAPVDTKLDHATSFCRRTIAADRPVAATDTETKWDDATGFETHGLRCYIGSSLTVDGERFGTVCFLAESARAQAFTPDEKAFIELFSRLVERDLESDERQQELARSKKNYQSLIETAPDAILRLNATDLSILDANEQAVEMTHYPQSDLIGSHAARLFPVSESEFEEVLARFQAAERTTMSHLDDDTPLVIERRDGSYTPVEVSASTVKIDGHEYLQAIIRDISDRRQRMEKLRIRTRAMDRAAVGIVIADATTPDNEIIYVNDRFTEITGYDEAAFLGENCRILQGPETNPDHVATLRAAIDAEEPVTQSVLNYRADGTPFWNQVTVTPVRDERGRVTHYIGFQQDITDSKRRERMLDVMDRILRHNLRNDMTVVGGSAEIIADSAPAGSKTAKLARKIVDTADALQELSETARTLRSATNASEQSRQRALGEMVTEAIDNVPASASGGTLETDIDDDAYALVTDYLTDAIGELVENALVHAGPDPTVTVSVKGGEIPRITITDDGPGLADGEQRVLEEGKETPLEHGSGLGLWFVHWVVTESDGRISVDSSDGTQVEVSFLGS